MMDGMGMMVWGAHSFLFALLLISFFVLPLPAALKWLWRNGRLFGRGESETPLDVLRKRFARGEIEREEFERIKKDVK